MAATIKIELNYLTGEAETLMVDPQGTFGSLKQAIADSNPDLRKCNWSLILGEQVLNHHPGALLIECGIEDSATLVVIKKAGRLRAARPNPRQTVRHVECFLFFGYNGMSLPGVLLQAGALLLLYGFLFPANAWTFLCSVVAMLLGVRLVIPLHDHHGMAQYLLQLALIELYLWGMVLGVPGAAEMMELGSPESDRAWVAPTTFSVFSSLALSIKWLSVTNRPFNDDTGLIGIFVLGFTALCASAGSLAACCMYYFVVQGFTHQFVAEAQLSSIAYSL